MTAKIPAALLARVPAALWNRACICESCVKAFQPPQSGSPSAPPGQENSCSTEPVLPNEPSLFYRAGLENVCEAVSQLVIDNGQGGRKWSSASPDAAIADFVAVVMGLVPSDERAAGASALLTAHFQAARAQKGINATDALRSTFIIACLAPSSSGVGL